jgi:hypothetical protein
MTLKHGRLALPGRLFPVLMSTRFALAEAWSGVPNWHMGGRGGGQRLSEGSPKDERTMSES